LLSTPSKDLAACGLISFSNIAESSSRDHDNEQSRPPLYRLGLPSATYRNAIAERNSDSIKNYARSGKLIWSSALLSLVGKMTNLVHSWPYFIWYMPTPSRSLAFRTIWACQALFTGAYAHPEVKIISPLGPVQWCNSGHHRVPQARPVMVGLEVNPLRVTSSCRIHLLGSGPQAEGICRMPSIRTPYCLLSS
jgi:hypothetical protein